MVLNFRDHHRPDPGVGIAKPAASPEVGQRRRVICAKRALAQSGELGPITGVVAAKRNAIFGRAKFHAPAVASEISVCVSRKEINIVPMGRTEPKAGRMALVWIELVFVKNGEAA